jgi:hypothetical protein
MDRLQLEKAAEQIRRDVGDPTILGNANNLLSHEY